MAAFNIGDEVEVIATGETSTVEAVTKNFFRQTRIKLVGSKSTYKESELRRVTTTTSSTTDDYTSDSTPDLVTQVVLANIYLDQMDDIAQNVTELNNTIPEVKQDDVVQEVVPSKPAEEVHNSFYTERVDAWTAPVSTESKSVDVDTSSSRSVSVEDSTSSWRSSSSDDSSSSWSSSSSDDNSSSRWSSSSDDSSSYSSSYDSSSSSSSSSD